MTVNTNVDAYRAAQNQFEAGLDDLVFHDAAQASQAISLKRVADNLGRIANALEDSAAWNVKISEG